MTKPLSWWNWLIILLAGLVIWQVVLNAGFLVLIALDAMGAGSVGGVWLHALGALVGLPILLLGLQALYRWPGRGLPEVGVTTQGFLKDTVLGLSVGAATSALSIFVVIPMLGSAADEVLSSVAPMTENPAMLLPSIAVLILRGGILEELFFRGHIITAVRNMLGGKTLGMIVAVIVSTLLFAVAHRYQGAVGLVSAVVFGTLWAGLFVWTKRLTAGIWAHSSHDVLTLLGIMFLVL